jgi:hypothetical protein
VTDYSDFITQIKDWINREDFSDALVGSFISLANQKLNAELRVDRMIATAQNTAMDGCAVLPDDWIESDFMLIASKQTPTGWLPIRYMPRDQYFRLSAVPYSGSYAVQSNSTWGYYTIEGRTIFFGGPVDTDLGTVFEMNYFQEVPRFSDLIPSWVYTKYPSLYLFAVLMYAYLHAVGEEDKAANMKQLAEDAIMKLNADFMRSKASGSRLARPRGRSFG